jgi:hypothetical protein
MRGAINLVTTRRAITAAAACAVLAVSLSAIPAAASASAPTTGRITGLVTGHGRPLQGICVFATQLHTGQFFDTHTSKSGHYTIGSVKPGRYYVTFAGCLPAVGNWLHQWYKGVSSPADSPFNPPHGVTAVRVRAGHTLTGIDARLKLGASISGAVTSASTGTGLSGLCVVATSDVPDAFDGEHTASGGHYSLHALFPATYRIEFTCGWAGSDNFAPQWWRNSATAAQATPVRITGAQNVRNVNGKLGPGAVITGTVRGTNASGPPLAGVCVSGVGAKPGISSALVITGTDGTYRLAGLATGKYVLTFEPDCGGTSGYAAKKMTVQTKAGTTLSGVNAYLQPKS